MQPTILKLNLILTIMASIPIAFMIACYITVKFVGLITSSLFPHTYISIRKLFCKWAYIYMHKSLQINYSTKGILF
jgi:hypothetical protein